MAIVVPFRVIRFLRHLVLHLKFSCDGFQRGGLFADERWCYAVDPKGYTRVSLVARERRKR